MKEVYGVNIILSYLIFNPLEACVLLLGCELFKKKEFDNDKLTAKQLLIDSYRLGFIICTFNMVGVLTAEMLGSFFIVLFQTLNMLCFLPLILFQQKRGIAIFESHLLCYVYGATLMLGASLFDASLYYEDLNVSNALLVYALDNLAIKILQFIMIFGGMFMKSLVKKSYGAIMKWDGGFTLFGLSSETLPESLSKMAEQDSDDSTEVE